MGNGKRFLIAKNELIKKYTGMDLVPEDQIIDDEKYDNLKLNIKESDSYICTYCLVHFTKYVKFGLFIGEPENKCTECPMYIAENDCENTLSTYQNIIGIIGKDGIIGTKQPWYDELVVLVDEYNKNSKYEEKQNALLDNSSK